MPDRVASAAAAVALALALITLAALGASATNTPRGTDPAHRITLGFLQYNNPIARWQDLSGYEQDARELLIATQIALEDINSNIYEEKYGLQLLPGYTLELDVRNTQFDSSVATQATVAMLDSKHNPAPPPIIMGFVGYEEAFAATQASQPYQVPLLSHFVSTPSLSTRFPTFNRYVITDQIEAYGMLTLLNTFGWNKVACVYNDDGGSASQLARLLQEFGYAINPNFEALLLPYVYSTTGATRGQIPDLTPQFERIKASGIRIILLSGFASDVGFVMTQARDNGLIGRPYSWLGTSAWCFDDTLEQDATYGPLLNGAMCLQNYVDPETIYYKDFVASWERRYAADPASVWGIPRPTLSAAAHDQVFGAAFALETLLELRRQCNLSAVGDNGRPFSGLIPPDLTRFNPSDYGIIGGLSESLITYTQSTVPTTSPDVCPWLLYQTGQGRVLTQLVRTQVLTAATGGVRLLGTGDRVGDISIYNIYAGKRALVGVMDAQKMFAQFGFTQDGTNTTGGSDPICVANGNCGEIPLLPVVVRGNVSEEWRKTYDPATFSYAGHYSVAEIKLALKPGGFLGENVMSQFHPKKIQFPDGTATVPLDSPRTVAKTEGISNGVRVAIFVLTCIVGLYNFLLLAFQIRYRAEKLIKATSPKMNAIFLLGVFGVLVYIILLGLDSDMIGGESGYNELCHVKFALLAISYSLAFGSLFAKTYRLDAIFNSKHLHVRVVKDRDILLIVGGLVLLDVILLAVWQGSSPFYRSLTSDSPVVNALNPNELDVFSRERCSSSNFNEFVITFLVKDGAVLLFGLYLALRVRKINISNLNDSKWIVMSIYNVVLISILLIVVSIVVSDQPDAFYLIVSIGLLYITTVVLSLLFLPRVLTLLWGFDFTADASSHSTGSKQHEHANTSSENNALKSENERLRVRLQNVQHDIADLKKQAHDKGVELKSPPPRTALGTIGSGGGHSSHNTPSQSRRPSITPAASTHMHVHGHSGGGGGSGGVHLTPHLTAHAAPRHHGGAHSLSAAPSPLLEPVRIHVHVQGEESVSVLSPITDPTVIRLDAPRLRHDAAGNPLSSGTGSLHAKKIRSAVPAGPTGPRVGGGGLPGAAAYNSQIGHETLSAFGVNTGPTAPAPSTLQTIDAAHPSEEGEELVAPPRAAAYSADGHSHEDGVASPSRAHDTTKTHGASGGSSHSDDVELTDLTSPRSPNQAADQNADEA